MKNTPFALAAMGWTFGGLKHSHVWLMARKSVEMIRTPHHSISMFVLIVGLFLTRMSEWDGIPMKTKTKKTIGSLNKKYRCKTCGTVQVWFATQETNLNTLEVVEHPLDDQEDIAQHAGCPNGHKGALYSTYQEYLTFKNSR